MKIYVLDTNIISYYLKGNEGIINKISEQRKSNSIFIPPMAYYEVKCDLLYVNATKKRKNHYTLVSNNMRHFKNIENLQVENWTV
jgi:predicted nucleic acid-binding protein